jgi:hypothetical protein
LIRLAQELERCDRRNAERRAKLALSKDRLREHETIL